MLIQTIGQSPPPTTRFIHLCPPNDSRIQPPSRPCPISDGRNILHLSYYVRRLYGT
jgi:hypothetical protein